LDEIVSCPFLLGRCSCCCQEDFSVPFLLPAFNQTIKGALGEKFLKMSIMGRLSRKITTGAIIKSLRLLKSPRDDGAVQYVLCIIFKFK